MSRNAPLASKLYVWARDKWKCQYCGCKIVRSSDQQPMDADNTATVDHVIARTHGGSHRVSNLVACCYRCNQLKGDSGSLEDAAPPCTMADIWPAAKRPDR